MAAASPRRWWALGAISLAVLAVTLDVTILTLALPTLAAGLRASESDLQWFVTAYTLALVAGMLPAGLVGDRYGRKAVMLAGLVVFAAGSLACAASPDAAVFTAARVVLGLAGAALIVVALSAITVLFDREERPRAVGIWGAANFIGLPVGPILGGWILSHAWWGWIFLMNLPVAVLALIAVAAWLPESRAPRAPAIDGSGVLLSSAGLVAVMYGVIQAGTGGWDDRRAVAAVAAGLVVLVAFVVWEQRVARLPGGQPLVDLKLFRSRSFSWGAILTAFGTLGLFGVFFVLPQYVQAVMGQSPQGAGWLMLPTVGGLIAGAVPADRVAARIGAKLTVAGGSAIVVAAGAVGATMTAGSGAGFIAAWTFAAGLGSGLGFATAASAALVEISPERSGVASAVLQAVVKLGPAFGSSVMGSALAATYQRLVDVRHVPPAAVATVKASVFGGVAVAHRIGSPALLASVRAAFVAGMDQSIRLAAAVALAALLLALLFLPSRAAAAGAAGGEQV